MVYDTLALLLDRFPGCFCIFTGVAVLYVTILSPLLFFSYTYSSFSHTLLLMTHIDVILTMTHSYYILTHAFIY